MSAALAAEKLVLDQLRRGEGGGKQYPEGVLHGVPLGLPGHAQQIHDGRAEQHAHQTEDQGEGDADEQRAGAYLAGPLVLLGPQEPGDIAGRADGEAHGDRPQNMHQRVVDRHGGRGVDSQLTDKQGVDQIVDRVDQRRNDHGDRHFGDHPEHGILQHHGAPALACQRLFLFHPDHLSIIH